MAGKGKGPRMKWMDYGHPHLHPGAPAGPPDPGGYPNEPAGFTLIAYSPFDVLPNLTSGTTPNGWVNPWARFGPPDLTEIIDDATAPTGNGKALRITYPFDWISGSAPAHIWTNWANTHGEVDELYMSWWFRLYGNGNDFEMNPVGVKSFFFSGPQSGVDNEFIPFFKGIGTLTVLSSCQSEMRQQNTVTRNLVQNVDLNNRILMGATWQQREIYAKTNDIGSANGLYKEWIDGVMTLNYSDVVYRNSTWPLKFRNINFNPTYGGGGPNKTREDFYDVSEIYVTGSP